MSLWISSILAIIFLIAGIIASRKKIKTRKLVWMFTYTTLFILCFTCILYVIATLFLIGGIE